MQKLSRNGFTLLEILVVIGAIAIIVTMATPLFNRYIERSKEAATLNILGNVRTAIAQYRATFNTNPSHTELATTNIVLEHSFPKNPFNHLNTIEPATEAEAYHQPRVTNNLTGWRYYNGDSGQPPVLYANSAADTFDQNCVCDL